MKYSRSSRISEEIRKIISSLIMNELKDPRISNLTSVTHVDTTNDLRYAYIYISVYNDEKKAQETIDGLNKAKGFIRKEIGKNIKLRYIPEPIFKLDDSIKQGIYMSDLITKVNKNNESREDNND